MSRRLNKTVVELIYDVQPAADAADTAAGDGHKSIRLPLAY